MLKSYSPQDNSSSIVLFIEINNDPDLCPREYTSHSCVLLIPKGDDCVEGIGSLVNITIFEGFRCIKDSGKEELCSVLACQCPTSEKVE